MVNCIWFLSGARRYHSIISAQRSQGAALITAVLILLGLALLGLSISGQQVVANYQQINLEERRLYRQLATEQLFDEVAQSMALNGRQQSDNKRGFVAHPFTRGGAGQRVLYSEVHVAECPHAFATLSQCWRVQVRQAGTGYIRERMLILPETSCSAPYWFPPQGRVVAAPPLPPADAPPVDENPPEPVTPPTKPKPGGGLRP